MKPLTAQDIYEAFNKLKAAKMPPPLTCWIVLTKGKAAAVDPEDYVILAQHRWYATWHPDMRGYYAARGVEINGKRTSERMHRVIMGLKNGDKRHVDHINHDTLDNRRSNLRVVSCRENAENRKNQSPHGSGVWLNPDPHRRNRPFMAKVSGKTLGYFATSAEATEARKKFISGNCSKFPK